MFDRTLILLRGVPGAGKTSLAHFLRDAIGHDKCVAIAADDWMFADGAQYDPSRLQECHEKCQEAARVAMADSVPIVIVHNTMTRFREAEVYCEIAADHRYDVVSLVVENRHGSESVHSVPQDAIQNFINRFELKLK